MAVADVDGDGQLEMLFGDSSGVVACVKPDGSECWNIHLSGENSIPGTVYWKGYFVVEAGTVGANHTIL